MSDRLAFRGEIAARYDHDNNSLNSPLSDSYGFPRHTGFIDGIITVGLTYSFGGVHAAAAAASRRHRRRRRRRRRRVLNRAPTKVTIDLRGVEFKFDHPRVGEKLVPSLKAPTADSVAILDEAIDTLKRNPNIRVEVDGHTDSVGTDAYNQKLSERRAKGVYDYLTAHGIDASRLDGPKGFGESQPIDTNDTAEGRQRNRRTELKVENSEIRRSTAIRKSPAQAGLFFVCILTWGEKQTCSPCADSPVNQRCFNPLFQAYTAACVRSLTPSFASTLLTCVLTVFSPIPRRVGDLLIAQAFGHQPQHFAFALAQ